MQLQFIGCGDAFGSGGRFNTCFHVTGPTTNFLIDCGASSLVALKQRGIDRNAIDALLVTHFHADHFGGVPFFMLDAQFNARRARPLTLAGPRGLPDWYKRVTEVAFPGAETTTPKFDFTLREIEPGAAVEIGPLRVTAFPVKHDERAGPCLAYRIEAEGKVLTFSGDTEWTDTLIEAAQGADLFVCEGYARDKAIKTHMNVALLESHLSQIAAKRTVLTHMGEDMLARRQDIALETAQDGLIVDF
jgi:ribonuclease BN (tRNA processing enzyme)